MYESGTHRTGLYNEFILYETSLNSLNFNLVSRTNDGLSITIKISYQYKIDPSLENLVYLSYNFPKSKYK